MLNLILLEAAKTAPASAEAAPQGMGGMSSLIMIVALIAIFYFFMIRPQNKKQKEIRKFRDAMQKGDNVTTAGGIHGKIELSAATAEESNTESETTHQRAGKHGRGYRPA